MNAWIWAAKFRCSCGTVWNWLLKLSIWQKKFSNATFPQYHGIEQPTVRHFRKENCAFVNYLYIYIYYLCVCVYTLRNAHLRTDWCAWPALIFIIVKAQQHYSVYCHTGSTARQTTTAWMEPFELPHLLVADVGNQLWDAAHLYSRGRLDVTCSSCTRYIHF